MLKLTKDYTAQLLYPACILVKVSQVSLSSQVSVSPIVKNDFFQAISHLRCFGWEKNVNLLIFVFINKVNYNLRMGRAAEILSS
jgi:hypothetical protein